MVKALGMGESTRHYLFDDELRWVEKDLGARRYRFGQPDIATDHGVRTDDRVAAKNSGTSIDRDVIFQSGMTFALAVKVAGVIPLKRQGAQGDTLVDFYLVADMAGLADNYTGAMVNKKGVAYFRARMDIDTGHGVGVFRHDTRQDGNF